MKRTFVALAAALLAAEMEGNGETGWPVSPSNLSGSSEVLEVHMHRHIAILLLAVPLSAYAQSKPSGACPFDGYQSDPQQEPKLAEVATKVAATTWLACQSPKGCATMTVEPGSPVLIYKVQGAWTCGYGADSKGAGPAWFRSADLRPVEFSLNPPRAAWYGVWKGGEDRVVISPAKSGGALHLEGKAIWQGGNGNEHFGDTKGDATPSGNQLHYVNEGCTIDLTLAGRYILADDNQGCGGMNARFGGFWKRAAGRAASAKP